MYIMTGISVATSSIVPNEDLTKKVSEETQEDKARKRKESHAAAVAKMIKEYNSRPFLYLKSSKVKDAVYSQILNPEAEIAKEELKLTRILRNQEEQEEFQKRKKEFEELGGGDKWNEKFVPQFDYDPKKLTAFAKNMIVSALEKEKAADREKFLKAKIKDWKESNPDKYREFQEFRKKLLKDEEELSLVELAKKFDEHILDGYVHHIRIKSKGKEELQFTVPQQIPSDKRYDYYRTLLTRGNVRFSKASQTYISIFIEDLARQVAFNCIHHTRTRDEDKISTESLNLGPDKDFLREFVPLADLIRFTKTYSEIEQQKFVREKKPRQKKTDKPEPKEEKSKKQTKKEQWNSLSIEEKVIETLSQDHYLKNQISNNCKVVLAQHFGENEESPFYKVKYSSFYVQFVAHLIGEIIFKIGRILKTQVHAQKSKTINQDLVKIAIEHLMVSLNVDDGAIRQTFKNLDAKFQEYEKTKPAKSKREEEESL